MTTFPALFQTITDWQLRTFGSVRERGPVGPLKHLAKEVLCELLGMHGSAWLYIEALDKRRRQAGICRSDPSSLEEHADCLILLMEAVRRSGHSADDLLSAVAVKHATNLTRTYPKPAGDEVCEHVKEAS